MIAAIDDVALALIGQNGSGGGGTVIAIGRDACTPYLSASPWLAQLPHSRKQNLGKSMGVSH